MRALSKLLLGVVLVGCSSSADEGVEIDSVESLIAFSPMYSAFDGLHEYALTPYIPRADMFSEDQEAILASSVKWEVEDAFVKREEFPDLLAAIKLTTKKVGATIVAATAKTISGQTIRGEAKLIISKADAPEWDAGEDYYNIHDYDHVRNGICTHIVSQPGRAAIGHKRANPRLLHGLSR